MATTPAGANPACFVTGGVGVASTLAAGKLAAVLRGSYVRGLLDEIREQLAEELLVTGGLRSQRSPGGWGIWGFQLLPGLPPLERRRPARLPDGRHNSGPYGIKEFKILPNGPSCTAGHRSTPDRRLRCSCLARVMSGSRGSRGSGSACLRCRVSAVRRCLVIRICDIARLLWSWVSVVTAKVAGEWPGVAMASRPVSSLPTTIERGQRITFLTR